MHFRRIRRTRTARRFSFGSLGPGGLPERNARYGRDRLRMLQTGYGASPISDTSLT